jgi:hypothetical protein
MTWSLVGDRAVAGNDYSLSFEKVTVECCVLKREKAEEEQRSRSN